MSNRDWLPDVDDYTTGTLAGAGEGPELDDFEEALFDAAANGRAPELAFLDTLATIAPWFAARGGFAGGLTREQVEELRGQPGVHYVELRTGVNEIGPWPAETQVVVYRVAVDMRGYSDIVVTLAKPTGEHLWTFRDGQFDPSDGFMYAACDEPLARETMRAERVVARIEAARAGKRELVGTFEMLPVG